MKSRIFPGWTIALATAVSAFGQDGEWRPIAGRLTTRWGEQLRSDRVLDEYPRPQMQRGNWSNLNGLWEYAIRAVADPAPPAAWDGKILVPYCVESALSGVGKRLGPDQALWYRRSIAIQAPPGKRVMLNFGAVDWEARVWVNGMEVGEHRGGYDAFTFDITEALRKGDNELMVRVEDPTDRGTQPRGKQVLEPNGIWYTAVSGIWQTVWLETVPQAHIRNLKIVPKLDDQVVLVTVDASEAGKVRVEARDGEEVVGSGEGEPGRPIAIRLSAVRAWSPSDPHLYDLTVRYTSGETSDMVTSYFGMRTIEVRPDESGVNRLYLNKEPLFQFGTLDQGWWPDGLYTAPSDEALRYDIEMTKRLGFNMIRKHVKVEPARWYYHCDRIGMLVWQDMPSGDAYIGGDQPDIQRSAESAATFERELRAMIDGLSHHASIVMWVPYNEGWGQWETARISELVRERDPTRLVNSASGWTDRGVGDVIDVHVYPGPGMARPEKNRASVLGEFGGLGLPMTGHTWQEEKNWGYRSFKTRDELNAAYLEVVGRVRPLIARGLSAAVYTQTTDVEVEVNGLMTYDRRVLKVDEKQAAEAAAKMYLPPPEVTTLLATSQEEGATWRFVSVEPASNWFQEAFDDSGWASGKGGFGTQGTPGAVVRTEWKSPDLWLRRTFELAAAPETGGASGKGEIGLLMHHDEDTEVYINGVPAAKTAGYVTDYTIMPISAEAAKALRKGRNTLAIHCRQTRGGQYIDAGLVCVAERSKPGH